MRTSGLFVVLEPVLEEGEIFDSTYLKETVVAEINKGNRNIVLDCAPFDYIYSDTINILLSLNRRILDVSGRLAILSPGPEVIQTLRKTGVHNILKIYASEIELQKSSEDIILQTSSFRLTDIQRAVGEPEQKPKSEFEDFRSQVGSAFGMPEQPAEEPAYQDTYETAYQAPAYGGADSEISLEPPQAEPEPPEFSPQPAFPSAQPMSNAPSYPAPPPPATHGYAPPPSGYQQPQPSQVPGYMVTPPPQQVPGYMVTPPPQGYMPPSQAQQYYAPPPQTGYQPQVPHFEPPSPPRTADTGTQKRPSVPDFERFDEGISDDFLEKSHKSPVVAILVTIVIILAIAAGAIFGIQYYLKNYAQKDAAVPSLAPEVTARVPAVPEPEPPVEEIEEIVEPKIETPPPRPRMTASRTTTAPPAARTTPRRSAPAPAPHPRTPAPQRSVVSDNILTITSTPSGATVTVDGEVKGVTPYRWQNPFFGGMRIALSKPGYRENSRSIEYLGGEKQESFTLFEEPASAPPPPAPEPPPQRPEPVVSAPAPEYTPQPAPSAPPPVAASPGGSEATIFISSLPPVADVYMDGKLIGKTNVAELKVLSGTHTMKFVKGGKEFVKEMTFEPGKNASQMIRIP